jgi:hypothetical protein
MSLRSQLDKYQSIFNIQDGAAQVIISPYLLSKTTLLRCISFIIQDGAAQVNISPYLICKMALLSWLSVLFIIQDDASHSIFKTVQLSWLSVHVYYSRWCSSGDWLSVHIIVQVHIVLLNMQDRAAQVNIISYLIFNIKLSNFIY